MDIDVELQTWRAHWQAVAPVLPLDLKARVERETRVMRWIVAAEVAVTVGIGGGTLLLAGLARRTDALILAIGTWIFIGIAWAVSFLLRRDAWAPASLTTAAFLDLSILRCKRRREAIGAQAVLYTAILTFDLIWIYFAQTNHPRGIVGFLTGGGIAWVWPVTVLLAGLEATRRRRLTRELNALTRLRVDLDP